MNHRLAINSRLECYIEECGYPIGPCKKLKIINNNK